jgi:quinol monooxygenase YgiN
LNAANKCFKEKGDKMIVVRMTMSVLPEKRLEMLQTLRSMIGPVEREPGCLRHCVFCDVLDEDCFCILEIWKNREDLDRHLSTDRFGALLGAKVLLCEPLDIEIHTVTETEGIEAVYAARGKK